jgi:CheY-like chemotaxis protein
MRAASDVFQVLLVENEKGMREAGAAHIGSDFDVQPIAASSQAEAEDLIDRNYFDAAVVDIELRVGDAGGVEVIRKLIQSCPTTRIVVGTQHHDEARVAPLLALTAEPQVIEIVYKDKAPEGWQRSCLEEPISAWRDSRIAFEGVDPIIATLRDGGRVPDLRPDEGEALRELDRLLRGLFSTLAPIEKGGQATVSFEPMRSDAGMSSAAVFEAEPRFGLEDRDLPVTGVECVVKVGARREIEEEAKRYDSFVRFGAHLSQRVELLSAAFEHSLGAICYSLVGAQDASVVAFDDALRDPDQEQLVMRTLKGLFSAENRSWYSVRVPKQAVTPFFRSTYSETMVEDGYRHLDESLDTLSNRCKSIDAYRPARSDEDGSLRIGGVKLLIPRSDLFGRQAFSASGPACLIHGDMHGGNVLVERTPVDEPEAGEVGHRERVCLIDYRYSGPGPRCVDFAALETSIRHADADSILADACVDAESPEENELDSALRVAARRHDPEIGLGMTLWDRKMGRRRPTTTKVEWQVFPSSIHFWAQQNFTDLTLEEYFATTIAAAIRQMSYDLEEVRRIRLLAWMSAQYQLLTASEAVEPSLQS